MQIMQSPRWVAMQCIATGLVACVADAELMSMNAQRYDKSHTHKLAVSRHCQYLASSLYAVLVRPSVTG